MTTTTHRKMVDVDTTGTRTIHLVGGYGSLPDYTKLTFASGRTITLAEVETLLDTWDGWEQLPGYVEEAPTPADLDEWDTLEREAEAQQQQHLIEEGRHNG